MRTIDKSKIKKLLIRIGIPILVGLLIMVLVVSIVKWIFDQTIGKIIEAVRGAITALKGVFNKAVNIFSGPPPGNTALQDAINKKLAEVGDVSMFGLTKEGVKNYLSKFIEAELSTTYPDLSSDTSDKGIKEGIQGNVRFKRLFGKEMTSMIYMENDEFMKYVNSPSQESFDEIKYRFTTDKDNPQQVIVASLTVQRIQDSQSATGDTVIYTINLEKIDLNAALSDYSMPFELPLILMMTTKSGDFGLAVANLALDSKVTIGIYDTQSVTKTKTIEDSTTYTEESTEYNGYEEISAIDMTGKTTLKSKKDFHYVDGPKKSERTVSKEIEETSTSNTITAKLLEAGGWIAEYKAEYAIQDEPKQTEPQQQVELTEEEKKSQDWKEKVAARNDSELNSEDLIVELREKKLKEFLDNNKGTKDVYNLTITSGQAKIRTRTVVSKKRSSSVSTSRVVEKSSKKLSREEYFLGLIRNATGNYERLYGVDNVSYNKNAKYNPNGKMVEYINLEYDPQIFSFLKDADGDDKYTTIDLPDTKEFLCEALASYNSTSNIEPVMRYLISILSGEKDKDAMSVNDFINGFNNMIFITVGGSFGGDTSGEGAGTGVDSMEQFIKFLHQWEGHEGITSDGKYYIVGDDGAGHPTVGYGVDIFNGGHAGKIRAAGYSTSIGAKIPVKFVDALEKEEIESSIKHLKSKIGDLGLTEYQMFAMISRAYNCGENGAIDVDKRTGKDFKQSYKAFWNPQTDNELGGKENANTYKNRLYSSYMDKPDTSGGQYMRGLELRRKAEWKLFKYGYYDRINQYWTPKTDTSGPSNSALSSSVIVQNAIDLHKWLRENGYKYRQVGLNIPIDQNGQGKYIDCSSYVSWVLYRSGFSQFKGYQKTSSVFNSNPWGWQQISSISNARAGDILCYNGHVEIYAGSVKGGKARVYNCGGASSIAAAEESTSGFTTSQITKILRPPVK